MKSIVSRLFFPLVCYYYYLFIIIIIIIFLIVCGRVINDPVVSPGCVERTILGWLTEWLTRFPADPPRGPAPPLSSPTLAPSLYYFFFRDS
jgi:hypothetical protein